jgi:hypothetical protein
MRYERPDTHAKSDDWDQFAGGYIKKLAVYKPHAKYENYLLY